MDADAPEPGPPGSRRTEEHERSEQDREAERARAVAQERARERRDGAVPESFDVTEPTEDGGPVHHASGGDIGDGGD